MKQWNQGDDALTEEMLKNYASIAKNMESILILTRGVLAMLAICIPTLTVATLFWMF